MVSLNCRTVWFGRDVRSSSTPASCSQQGQLWDHSFLLYLGIKKPHQHQHSWYTLSSWNRSSDIYICEKWIFFLVEVVLKIIFWYHLAQLHGFGLKSRCISWQTTIRINCIVSNSVSLQYYIKSWAQKRLQEKWCWEDRICSYDTIS